MKTILVTGGAGFIGSNFIKYALNNIQDIRIINYDALTYAGNLKNLVEIENNSRYTFIKGDICDKNALFDVFLRYSIDYVVNFAAESHVDRSIENADRFIHTNVLGCQTLLDTALHFWKVNKDDKYSREYKDGVKFIQISTDEVYGSLGDKGYFTEESPIAPSSPYSASKASADLICLSYFKTYGFPVNITRCSNNYGSYQFPEKLIPLMINNCVTGKELPIYGDGLQIRDWLHVNDHCDAIMKVIFFGKEGEVYNIGGNNEKTNLEIVELIIHLAGGCCDMIKYVKDRPGHDRRYAIDSTKIKEQLGWLPKYTFEEGIRQTVEWYLSNKEWIEDITSGEYLEYYHKMYFNI